MLYFLSQPAITCSKLKKETPEQRCEVCLKLTIKPTKQISRFIKIVNTDTNRIFPIPFKVLYISLGYT